MSEFNERRWAVLSERGCEATDLTYMDAHQLMLKLAGEKVSGVSVITDDAARRISQTERAQDRRGRRQARF